MTEIESKLREAGIDVDAPKLSEVAFEALRRSNHNESLAARSLVTTVMTDARLLLALLDVSMEDVRRYAASYVEARELDMRGGVGQFRDEGHVLSDRPSPAPLDSSRESLRKHDSHMVSDLPAAPSMREGGEGRISTDSQRIRDLPARHAPRTKISLAAARSVANSSVYDMRIGTEITFRTATLFDVINAERAGSRYTRVMTLLRTRKAWPEDATLPKVYTEAELTKIIKEADDAMPPLPLEARA